MSYGVTFMNIAGKDTQRPETDQNVTSGQSGGNINMWQGSNLSYQQIMGSQR